MNYVFRFIFVFISLQFYVTLVHSKAGSYILPEAADVIDVTKAPFYADNSGKIDCYTALQKEETPLIRFLDDDFCNQAYFNGIRHITIEIGKNNPSAIAVD